MKLIIQSLVCCCVMSTVAHCVDLKMNPELKKRLSVWLESRLRRDLNIVFGDRIAESGQFVRPEDMRDALIPNSSNDIRVRTKRSKNSVSQSKKSGCSLGTCTVHDLAHRLHMLSNKGKIGTAPATKISPHGYGRRRRSLPERKATLRLEHGRLRPVWSNTDSQVHKLEALLSRT